MESESTRAEFRAPVEERGRLLLVARRFYLEDRSKVEIAAELGVSRFKVARMLEQARASGLVTITFDDEGAVDHDLSARLATHLGLSEAVVVHAHGDPDRVRTVVAQAGAEHLANSLSEGSVIGMAWGKTLADLTASLPRLSKVSVVQLTGAVGADVSQSPVELVRRMAHSSGGAAYPIFAPLLLDTAETAAALRAQPEIARAMAMYADVTTALLSVGSWNPPDSQLYWAVAPAERDELVAQGVVAEVSSILIADDGSVIADEFAERSIAITPTQLRAIPRVLAVAAGVRKARAVNAVARAGLITGLVTDAALAETILGGLEHQPA